MTGLFAVIMWTAASLATVGAAVGSVSWMACAGIVWAAAGLAWGYITHGEQRMAMGDDPWEDSALCRQVDTGDLFFPERGSGAEAAKRICHGCPVQAECLEHALKHDERYGIYGGLSPRQRRALRRAS